MKILVTVKRIPDPDESLKFAGGGLDYSASKWVPNAFDEYAIETALRLAEVVGGTQRLAEVIVLSICPEGQRQHRDQRDLRRIHASDFTGGRQLYCRRHCACRVLRRRNEARREYLGGRRFVIFNQRFERFCCGDSYAHRESDRRGCRGCDVSSGHDNCDKLGAHHRADVTVEQRHPRGQ